MEKEVGRLTVKMKEIDCEEKVLNVRKMEPIYEEDVVTGSCDLIETSVVL